MEENRFVHYKLGIPEIDDAHWASFVLMSRIKSTSSVNDIPGVVQILNELYSSMEKHFVEEERMLVKMEYKYIGQHKKEHVDVLSRLVRLIKLVESTKYLYRNVVAELELVLVTHIDHSDRQYALQL
jgi:hemerythrin-like metal-binding protein